MLRSGRCFVGKVLGRGPNGLPPTCIPVALRNNSRINFLAAGMGYSANRDIEVTVMFGSARRLGVAPAISTTPRALLRAVALFLLAATLFTAPICAGAGIYGGWVPAPDVLAPGIPVAELTIGGSPYLLLEGAGSAAPLDAVLWNPGNTISLTPGPGVVIDILNGVAGMQTSAGPRVFAWGNFELAGVATRIMMWDGTAWGLPGGAILGVVPRVADVRNTPAGPELWVGGDLMLFPGLAGATSLAHFDGVQWATPGVVLGIVKELMVAAEGSLNGDSIYIAGALGSAGGVPLQNLGRYDGGWSDVAGGLPGPDHSLSLIDFTPRPAGDLGHGRACHRGERSVAVPAGSRGLGGPYSALPEHAPLHIRTTLAASYILRPLGLHRAPDVHARGMDSLGVGSVDRDLATCDHRFRVRLLVR